MPDRQRGRRKTEGRFFIRTEEPSLCLPSVFQEIGSWDGARKADAIRKGYANGISIRQLSRITGISKAVIERVLKEE